MHRGMVVGSIAIILAVALAMVFILKSKPSKPVAKPVEQSRLAKTVKETAPLQSEKKAPVAAKKIEIAKGMGGLTLKVLGPKDREAYLRSRVFRESDVKSSTYCGTLTTNRIKELEPGRYDIEIATTPPKLYKAVEVRKGEHTVEDLGRYTGSVRVDISDAGKRALRYPVKVLYPKSGGIITSGTTNKPIELVAGIYDIDIASYPGEIRRDVKIEEGKDTVIDLGSAGRLLIKATDEKGKDLRLAVKVRKAGAGELVRTFSTNRPADILPGTYDIELGSVPVQTESGVKVGAGKQEAFQFVVKSAGSAGK